MHIYRLRNRAALARYFSDKTFNFHTEDTEPLVIKRDIGTIDVRDTAKNTCDCLYCRGARLAKRTLPTSITIAVMAFILFTIIDLAIRFAVLRLGGWRPQ